MADYGIKIAKSGYDVSSASEENLAFSSAFNSFKIVASGSTTLTIPAEDTYIKIIYHYLGYYPAFMAFFKNNNGDWQDACRRTSIPVDMGAYGRVNTNDLRVKIFNNTGSEHTADIVYFIFADVSD